MVRWLMSLVLLFAVTGSVLATDPPVVAVDVTGLADGTYVLAKNGGIVSVRPLQLIVPNVAPIPPGPPPEPVNLSERAKAFAAKASMLSEADKSNAPALATLYRELAKAARVGQISDAQSLAAATKAATDLLLPGPKGAGWAPVRDQLSAEWSKLAQSGAQLSSYADLLEDAAKGIEAVSPRAIDPATLALILEIIKIVLSLIQK